ncbi:MAG: thiol:disulfide interchange protein DsbA/DsbL [Pseudomonadota bacterium]
MSRKSDNVTLTRNLILAFVALMVVGVGTYGFLYVGGATGDSAFVAGRDWTELDTPTGPTGGPGPHEVVEFFSYGCIHCKNFDPLIERWQEQLPRDVRFERAPVSFSPVWGLLAQAYLTLEIEGALEANHQRLFRAIHDQQRQFLSAEQLADYVEGRGISRERFLDTFNSSRVRRKLAELDKLSRDARVRSVPTLLVANRYLVSMEGGRKRALDIVDHLLERERGQTEDG